VQRRSAQRIVDLVELARELSADVLQNVEDNARTHPGDQAIFNGWGSRRCRPESAGVAGLSGTSLVDAMHVSKIAGRHEDEISSSSRQFRRRLVHDAYLRHRPAAPHDGCIIRLWIAKDHATGYTPCRCA
jgi:hypothetical protein